MCSSLRQTSLLKADDVAAGIAVWEGAMVDDVLMRAAWNSKSGAARSVEALARRAQDRVNPLDHWRKEL
jgi:hypothetical protein